MQELRDILRTCHRVVDALERDERAILRRHLHRLVARLDRVADMVTVTTLRREYRDKQPAYRSRKQ